MLSFEMKRLLITSFLKIQYVLFKHKLLWHKLYSSKMLLKKLSTNWPHIFRVYEEPNILKTFLFDFQSFPTSFYTDEHFRYVFETKIFEFNCCYLITLQKIYTD